MQTSNTQSISGTFATPEELRTNNDLIMRHGPQDQTSRSYRLTSPTYAEEMKDLDQLKKEAEEKYPLPAGKYIDVNGGTMDCGTASRALAFTFCRRADYINNKMEHGGILATLRRLMRSLDVEHCANTFLEAAQEARDVLALHDMNISQTQDADLVIRAEALGIGLYTEAQRYGDGHPKGCFIVALDTNRAKLIEKTFGLETGNAPEFYDIAAIDASEDKNDMSVWTEYDDEERFIEITAEDDGIYTMVFGEERLRNIVETLEKA